MTRRRRFPLIGTALAGAMIMLGGAKLSLLLPLDDESRAALSNLGAAMAAEANPQSDDASGEPLDVPEGGARLSTDDVTLQGVPSEILRSIALERELLEEQKQAAAEERAKIALSREMLAEETARLSELKSVIEVLLAQAETQHTTDIQQLTELYRNMKPAEAANIMAEMDLQVTVAIIDAMVERDAAGIMARLPVSVSHAISRIMLERGKLPGDQTPVSVRMPRP